jgi:hypothetical protein
MMFKISGQTALAQLREKWGFDEDRAIRILAIARSIGPDYPDCEPVTGGLITVTYRSRSAQEPYPHLYTIEENTGKRVAQPRTAGYTRTRSPVRETRTTADQKKVPKMPARARKAAAAPAPEPEVVEETAGPDLTTYLTKDYSPTMSDYLDWAAEQFGDLTQYDAERLFVLGTQMYPHFQKSDLNQSRKAERKAARDAAAASNGQAEESAAPAKPVAAKPTAPARGRRVAKPTAQAEAPF